MKKLFVVWFAALLLVVFAAPAVAKVELGGIVFVDFMRIDRDKDSTQWYWLGDGSTSYSNLSVTVPAISRLYARWTNEDNVGMYIELGIGQPDSWYYSQGSENRTELRKAYGWWDIGDFQVMAGKSTTPLSPLNPDALLGAVITNCIGEGYGELYSGRTAQVRGTWKFANWGRLAVALVDPNGRKEYGGEYGPWYGRDVQSHNILPRLDVGAPMYFSSLGIYPSLMVQKRSADVSGGGSDSDVISWAGSLGVKGEFHPFTFKVEINMGQNLGNTTVGMGDSLPGYICSAVIDSSGKLNDARSYLGFVDLGYNFSIFGRSSQLHFIYGVSYAEVGYDGRDITARSDMWGFSLPVDIAKGLRVRAEWMNYDDGSVDFPGHGSSAFGKYAIYGVQFQITF